jgi:magnesium chelatase subunit I
LVYEGEQEGVINVAKILIGKAVKKVFEKYFPVPDTKRKEKISTQNPDLEKILTWFANNNMIRVDSMAESKAYIASLSPMETLDLFVKENFPSSEIKNKIDLAVAKEFVLEALFQSSFLSKFESNDQVTYKDLVGTIFNSLPEDDERDINFYS